MPSYGEKQMPAGVVRNIAKPILGKRTMVSRNSCIDSSLGIDNCSYRGNAVLNANRQWIWKI